MSPEEFMQSVAPNLTARNTSSKLVTHREAIEKLRAAGYSLQQVCAYLEQCGVSVSHQMLSKFIRGPSTTPTKPATRGQARTSPVVAESSRPPLDAAPSGKKSREEIAAENPSLSKKQVDEMYVDQFQQRFENPLLRRAK